jgi:arsenite-transporting ATPase
MSPVSSDESHRASGVTTVEKNDELIVEVGVIRRHIGLPQSMAALQPRRAGFEGDVLVVDLADAV